MATGSADRSIKVWDIATRQCMYRFCNSSTEEKNELILGIRTLLIGSKCHDLVVMDATGTLISGHYDKKIRIWDPNDDRCRTELDYDASITSLAFNDGKKISDNCLFIQLVFFHCRSSTTIIGMFQK